MLSNSRQSTPKFLVTPSPRPTKSNKPLAVYPFSSPIIPELKPKTVNVPGLPQPIIKPYPPKPSPSPTEASGTSTIDIDKPAPPEETEPQTITFETVPAAVSEIMSRDTVYLPAFGCSGSLIRSADGTPIGFTTASHCGLILTDDINEKTYNQAIQKPIPGIDGMDYLVFPNGLDVKTGDSQDALSTVGTYNEILVPTVGDRSTDFAIGALEGYSIQEVTAAYRANKTPQNEKAALKIGDILYSSGWPVNQPDNTSGSIRPQEFAETYLGTMSNVYFDNNQTISNLIVTVVTKNKDGAMCSPGKSGSKLFKYDSTETDGRPDSALGTLTGGHWSFGNPGFESELKIFAERFNVVLNKDEVAAICMYSTKEPSLDDPENPGSIVKAVAHPIEIPGYDKLYSREAMFNQIKENLEDSEYSHSVIDGIVQILETVEYHDVNEQIVSTGDRKGGGESPAYKATFLDRPGILYSPVTGAAVVYALDSSAPD